MITMRNTQFRVILLSFLVFGAGAIVGFLAGSKLAFDTTISHYDAAVDREIIKTLRTEEEANAATAKDIMHATKKTDVDIPPSPLNETAMHPKAPKDEIVQNTPSPSARQVKIFSNPGCPDRASVEVLPNLLSPEEAENVFWVLIVHFTGKPDRFKTVPSTWLKRTHPRMAFIIFTHEKNKALMDGSGIPTVYYPSIESETEHTLRAIRAALSMFPNAVYLTKADDDVYVYTERLAKTLFSNIPYNYQGQRCPAQHARLNLGEDFVYACGGSGYTLTRYAAEKLVKLSNPPQHMDFEDVGVGLRLKHALGSEFGLRETEMYWKHFWAAIDERPQNPMLAYHYVTPPVMESIHDEAYLWRPEVPRSLVSKIFHHLENEPIHHSCLEVHPKWTIMTWTVDRIKGLSERSRRDLTFVQYDVLFRHGGIFLRSNDTCKQPLDARLEQFAKDFDHDGYYLAYDFHEHGFRSGLFVMRALSELSMTLYRAAEANLSSHPLEHLKSARINIAILPASGLFERR